MPSSAVVSSTLRKVRSDGLALLVDTHHCGGCLCLRFGQRACAACMPSADLGRFASALCVCAVQHEAIPQALMRQDILCQAKSGMGKTAVFVISILQNLEPKKGVVQALVLCHTRELSFQVSQLLQISALLLLSRHVRMHVT